MSKNILAALLCVFLFSLTAPFTRLAAMELSAISIIFLRICGAGIVCLIFIFRERWVPPRRALFGILKAAAGTVIGFNSLMAFGLKQVPSGHAAVALSALPIGTAIYASLRDRVNPGGKFWFFAITGTLLSLGFFLTLNVDEVLLGDIYLLCAVVSASFGYVEGGRVSREFGGARVMSWAVIIILPIVIPLTIMHFKNGDDSLADISFKTWLAVTYLAMFSQSLGMFLWFKVLAIGPMQKVALVQLLQPFFTLGAAIFLVSETVTAQMWIIAVLVGLCVLGSIRERTT